MPGHETARQQSQSDLRFLAAVELRMFQLQDNWAFSMTGTVYRSIIFRSGRWACPRSSQLFQ